MKKFLMLLKKQIQKAFFCATVFLSSVVSIYGSQDLADYYGYSTPKEKKAIELILKASHTIQKSLSESFPLNTSETERAKSILHFITKTQNHVRNRTHLQERWEGSTPNWTLDPTQTVLLKKAFQTLGFTQAIHPSKPSLPDTICIFGGTKVWIDARMQYAQKLLTDPAFKTIKTIILLGGERSVNHTGVDGTPEYLTQLTLKLKFKDSSFLTENELLEDAYNRIFLENQKKKLTLYVINTPKRSLPRPTTQTTLEDLVSWSQQHPEIKTIFFISNQPHIGYQKAITQEVFHRHEVNLQYDIIGPEVDVDTSIASFADAFASTLWAKTPLILRTFKTHYQNEAITETLKKLYNNHPLVYQSLLKTP